MQKYFVNESGYYFNVTKVAELFDTVDEATCLQLVAERTGLDIAELDINHAIYVEADKAFVLTAYADIKDAVEFCNTFEM